MSSAPDSLDVWRTCYRLAAAFCLVLGLAGSLLPLQAAPAQVSRMLLLEEASRRWGGQPFTEAEALQCGLLEPYSDGKYHLDWPLSRGAAARVLARVVRRLDPEASFPKVFGDVTASAPVAPALAVVGQAFRPAAGDRFVADQIFSPDDLAFAFATLGPLLPASRSLRLPPADADLKAEMRIGLGFPDRSGAPPRSLQGEVLASDVARLARLTPLVPADQLAPQNAFDLEAASAGVTEMETALDSFEGTVGEVVLARPADPVLENEVRDFLGQMQETLRHTGEKLRLSRRQLQAALLVDPPSMRRCVELRSRIDTALFRLDRLAEQVDRRLAPTPPTGGDQ